MMGALWLLASAPVLGVCIVLANRTLEYRSRPGALPFAFFVVSLSVLTALVTLQSSGIVPADIESWDPLVVISGWTVVSITWAAFAFEYTGRGPVMTRRRGAALAAFAFVVTLSPLLGVVLTGWPQQLSFLLTSALQIGVISLAVFGTFLIVQSGLIYDELPAPQGLLLTGGSAGVISLVVPLFFTPPLPYETALSVLFVQLSALVAVLVVTQVRYGLFETGPSAGHLARETVLETMADAVFVVDCETRILDANRAAERTFGIDRLDLAEHRLSEAVGIDDTTPLETPVRLETELGRRTFIVTRDDLADSGDTLVGYVYRFTDVTERQTHEQRLEVFNRLLRHNLRNDLDAIRAFAETLGEDDDETTTTIAERIQSLSSELTTLGETIERAEALLTEERLETQPVDLSALVEQVLDEVGVNASNTVRVSVSVPDEIEVYTDGDILRMVLEELLENAVTHTDRPEPTVELVVGRTPGTVWIDVRDDGPGIPDHERAILLEGEETPLRHGSGVGLWLVSWAVTRLGGRLAFSGNDPRGSVVRVEIPNVDDPLST